MRARAVLFKAHVYAGTLASLPLLVIVLTGIVLGFYDPLRYAAPPYRLERPAVSTLPPATLVERFQALQSDSALNVLYLPTAPDRAARMEFTQEGRRTVAFLDPTTGRAVALRDPAEQDWLQFLYQLHRGKALGLAGQIIASATGAMVLLLWLAGLVLWWRRRAMTRSLNRRDPRTRLLTAHRWIGVRLTALPVLLAAVGALLNFAGPLGQAFNPAPRMIANAEMPPLALDRIVAAAGQAYPAAPLERIYFPERAGALWQFRFRDGGRVFVTGDTGRTVKMNTPFSHWTNALYPLHSGRVFGEKGPVAMAVLGMVLLASGISGAAYWWPVPRK